MKMANVKLANSRAGHGNINPTSHAKNRLAATARQRGKRRLAMAVAGLGFTVPLSTPHAAQADSIVGNVINFHDASQNYSAYTTNNVYNGLYVGQGAVADPGNNIWNGFGNYGGPGSTAFYGAGHPIPLLHQTTQATLTPG